MADNSNWNLGANIDIAALASDALQAYYNYQAVKETNEQNYQIFRETLDWNKPINQMIRFKEAGLNPNLIYGQGNAGNATAMPTMKAPQIDLDLTQRLSTIYGIRNMKEQNKNLQEQNSLLESQASVQKANAEKLQLEIDFFRKHNYWPSEETGYVRTGRQLLNFLGGMLGLRSLEDLGRSGIVITPGDGYVRPGSPWR